MKHTTVRMFFAIAAVHSMCVHQLDVESSFIYALLHEDVYMHPHPAMNIQLLLEGIIIAIKINSYYLKKLIVSNP